MTMQRTRRQLRILRKGAAALAAIYKRDGDLRSVAVQAWSVATRQGLIGLHDWLAVPPPTPTVVEEVSLPDPQELYRAWLARFDPLRESQQSAARAHLGTLQLPDVLIAAVVTSDSVNVLARMAASWAQSLHTGWRAILIPAADLSTADMDVVWAVAEDSRIEVATNGIEIVSAQGRFAYTILCVGGVLLNGLSTYMLLEGATRTGSDIVYSDHDLIDQNGNRSNPSFKPQYSPEYLHRYNYVGACFLLARSAQLSASDAELLIRFDLLEYDRLVARLLAGRVVEHLPFVLFHSTEVLAHVEHDKPVFPDIGPTVSIIIPTRDGLDHLRACIDSIVERTTYDLGKVEIVVVDNNSIMAETLEYLEELTARPGFNVVRFPETFNFSKINNVGAQATRQEILVFVNNDTTVNDPAWLSKLVWYASQPGVGMVGGRLLFPDGTIQHGGCAVGAGRGTVQHRLVNLAESDVQATDHTREMTVVTGACMALRRDVLDAIGGFDPILRVTWNDVYACMQCVAAGLQNIYLADSLLYHDESKTRGPDVTRQQYHRFFGEAAYTRRRFRSYFFDDPSYSPNLSSGPVDELADPPRVRPPWFRMSGQPPRLLLLSSVYRIGFGVPLVIHQQAMKLKHLGFDVVVGGPIMENEFSFAGCERVAIGSVKEAAEYAFTNGIALAICHTPPFFTLPIHLGGHIPVLAYDYGEPDPEFFPEPVRSYLLEVGYEKREAAALTSTIATISQAVKDETLNRDALVLGLANSHLPAWSEESRPVRDVFRREQGWENSFVVLTVCRFHVNERAYKGLDKIARILGEMPYLHPDQSRSLVWVLAGSGTPEDVEQVEGLGFTVFPNVSDDTLADLYRSADAYMGMSRWEGYNLGISQALAMGLPTLGSDIPAHREFPITTTNSVLAASAWLAKEVERHTAATAARVATVYSWDQSTTAFAEVVKDALAQSEVQKPRRGASELTWKGSNDINQASRLA